jgi:hypothetical protein
MGVEMTIGMCIPRGSHVIFTEAKNIGIAITTNSNGLSSLTADNIVAFEYPRTCFHFKKEDRNRYVHQNYTF